MPVSHSFDGDVVVIRMHGLYSTQELRDAIEGAFESAHGAALSGLLFDVSESGSLENRTASDVTTMARFLSARGSRFGNRLAMVAPTDLAFGLMRMGAVLAEDGGVVADVFRDVDAARAWLEQGNDRR